MSDTTDRAREFLRGFAQDDIDENDFAQFAEAEIALYRQSLAERVKAEKVTKGTFLVSGGDAYYNEAIDDVLALIEPPAPHPVDSFVAMAKSSGTSDDDFDKRQVASVREYCDEQVIDTTARREQLERDIDFQEKHGE